MKAFLAHVLLLFTLVGACAACHTATVSPMAPEANTRVVQNALAATVTLYDSVTLEGDTGCAGQRISPTKIVTAEHCAVALTADLSEMIGLLKHNERFDPTGRQIRFSRYASEANKSRGYQKIEYATVLSVHELDDVAILETEPSSQPYVQMRLARPVVGEFVFVLGHPNGLIYTFSGGYVSAMRSEVGVGPRVQIDASVWGGNSGGGVYDSEGQLIGVTSERVLNTYLFAAPVSSVLRLLNQPGS